MSLISNAFAGAVNHILAQSSWASDRLCVFAGSNVRLDARPVELIFGIDHHGHLGPAHVDVPPEVTLCIPFAELPAALVGGSAKLMNVVRIEGNAELADTLGFVFRNLRWDVEEDLSRVLGDIPARRLSQGAEAVRDAQARAWEALQGNLTEYMTEEQNLLVTRGELGGLEAELMALRDDIARLEKRSRKLQRRTSRDK